MKEITVFLADDHPVFLSGLQMLIESDPEIKIVGVATDGSSALEQIRQLKPDVSVLDLGMPNKNGFEIVRALRGEGVDLKVVLLTMHDEEATLNSALDMGINGYLLKDSAAAEIANAIKSVAEGNNYFTPKLTDFLLKRSQNPKSFTPNIDKLTRAEIQILRLIAEQKTTKEIASQLYISPRTVDRHRYNICNKLGIGGINSLLKFAIDNKSKLLFV